MVIDEVLQCPACKPSARTILLESTKDDDRLLRCSSCSKRFTQDKDDGFFSFFIGARKSEGSLMLQEQMEGSFFTNRKFKELCLNSQIFHLRQTLKQYGLKTMIDVGCGTGEYALHLKGLYRQYYGLEPFPVPAELAVGRSALPENAVLVQYDSTNNLPVSNQGADILLLIASYDHIPNPENFLKDAYNKIKDGGYLLIMCSNYNFWAKRLVNKITGKK
ncbi:MAG: methyltransferase domain-containing protein, partial [Candidatus Colwellbacteria bacterium]|nr:methyltransferase domain-containing protein [Candidatus Colwellbacteria bacterium]